MAFNISAYNNGMMGYRTLTSTNIANEGALFLKPLRSTIVLLAVLHSYNRSERCAGLLMTIEQRGL
ncbi:hypothetical protein O9929_23140 [Vibrio lentus]|nr:hypothetical protein [Vibrio lentus]